MSLEWPFIIFAPNLMLFYSQLSLSRLRLSQITALSRSKNLVLFSTRKSNSRLQNIVEKRRNCFFYSFLQYFQYSSNFRVKLHIFMKCGSIYFFFSLNSANLICLGTDKYFTEFLGLQDNKSWLYLVIFESVSLNKRCFGIKITIWGSSNE